MLNMPAENAVAPSQLKTHPVARVGHKPRRQSMTISTTIDCTFLTSQDAADLLRVSQLTIQRWASARAFPVFRYMKHLRFRRDDLIRFAESRVRPASDPDRYAASED
jgi:excisionase family DNA binding protein